MSVSTYNLSFKTKEENLKKMMKEYGDIENDLKIVQSICKKNK